MLIWLDRPADALPAVDAAQRTLLGERAPALAAFATGYERELYLTGIDLKARALANLRDHEALLALCEPVVRDIETERARVSSPYQQSAFLATRAALYEFCAAAAYRLKRWDLLLETTELLKARAALRSLVGTKDAIGADASVHAASVAAADKSTQQGAAASDSPDLASIEKNYRDANAALAAAPRGSSAAAALIERRRWLADARAIATARATDRLGDRADQRRRRAAGACRRRSRDFLVLGRPRDVARASVHARRARCRARHPRTRTAHAVRHLPRSHPRVRRAPRPPTTRSSPHWTS